MSTRPVHVEALPPYRIRVRFSDGVEGTVDLSHLRNHGVFRRWEEPGFFEQVFISADAGTVSWPGQLDLDPDVLYARATGMGLGGAGGVNQAA